ncbi:Insulinase (Peptidase family M16) [Oceanospirillum multiglobuliferum]|uniref:Uncharacterized protein n=1 Tax=Oceanospirillum multiglobuliferum TaxID=64969 RepID=A0A1T4S5D8_9GAMM|nr:insulinase family protein [Oceanospirillum multiglobuliferum]OPX54459.1 hypothetical protein BTE48_14175 [Oceanospirillum multiglobuliferum]SKA23434.1 Insulinase (Peptidase family M16) [Oceanospirillum multiglobuliferum]
MDAIKILLQGEHSQNCKIVLTVGSGSAHEPEHWQGLAHLLEHSLFLGSQSQTESLQAGAIQAELLQMGGSINASTQLFHTSYMLECPANQFERALALLCLLVFNPIFDLASVIAELDIIEAEYQARCGDSWQQVQAVIQQISLETHPFHHFCAGNKTSLGGSDTALIKALSEFYLQQYQLGNISLFIQHPAIDHDPSLFQQLYASQPLIKDEITLRYYVEKQISEAFDQAQFSRQHLLDYCADTLSTITSEVRLLAPLPCPLTAENLQSSSMPDCPSLPLASQQYAIKTSHSGYEWCWALPSLLLPAVDQLSLPDGFQARIRMLSPEQLILGIQLSSALTLSLNDMENERQFLLEQLELKYLSSHCLSLAQVVQQALYHHYDLPIIQPDILKNSLMRYLNRPAQLQLICHPQVQGTQQTEVFPTRFQLIEADFPALPANTEIVQMPFITLRNTLMKGGELNFDQPQSVPCHDPFNHAALIWLQPTLNANTLIPEITPQQFKQAEKQIAHQFVWHYQQTAYYQLRVKQRLGYIVHLGYQEIAQQTGVLLLIQGESRFKPKQLLTALDEFLVQINLERLSIDEDKKIHWQNYQKQHQLSAAPVALDWLPVKHWNQVKLVSVEA